MEIINNTIASVVSTFIESIICFNDYWLLVTQIDAFVRNDTYIDPCAIVTTVMTYSKLPTAKISEKSYKRST